ncbi:MAG: hypothetical protein KKH98_07020 [Spirochaetes bacterium]|nr:hypothetical protein [Spirochaetota bacterium]
MLVRKAAANHSHGLDVNHPRGNHSTHSLAIVYYREYIKTAFRSNLFISLLLS